MASVPIIDADGHILEENDELEDYFEGPYEGHRRHQVFGLFPSLDGWPRGAVKGLKKASQTSPESWLEFIDGAGIEAAVLYPTAGLGFGLIQDSDWAGALARAYNNWFHDKYTRTSPRLKGVAILPVHDVPQAVEELRHAVTEQGMVAGLLPRSTCCTRASATPTSTRSTRRRNAWTARWRSTAPRAKGSGSTTSRPCP